jgi:nucleotide-binding universal stress UspA family protein
MFERVVVPVDFSAESEQAIPVALAIAAPAQASVELVTVVEPIRRDEVEVEMIRLARSLGDAVEWRVIETGGPAEAALLAQLHGSEQSLWCVGSHARGALGELLLGSLSEQLVREAHVPVLVVGPHASAPATDGILAVALDGSDRSEAILPAAHDLAGELGMRLRLLQVIEPVSGDRPDDVSETAYLARVATTLPDQEAVDYDVLHDDDAANGLADYLERQEDVAMVAIATRGLSGGARLRHGSTAFEVAHRVGVPVLILHAVDPND